MLLSFLEEPKVITMHLLFLNASHSKHLMAFVLNIKDITSLACQGTSLHEINFSPLEMVTKTFINSPEFRP